MGLFKKTDADRELRDAKRDLNTRFNRRDTDPNDPAYIAANDRAGKAAERVSWLRRG